MRQRVRIPAQCTRRRGLFKATVGRRRSSAKPVKFSKSPAALAMEGFTFCHLQSQVSPYLPDLRASNVIDI